MDGRCVFVLDLLSYFVEITGISYFCCLIEPADIGLDWGIL